MADLEAERREYKRIGEGQVRLNIATNVYSEARAARARVWLEGQERARIEAATASQLAAAESQAASAQDQARETRAANTHARNANRIAIIALVIAIASLIISIWRPLDASQHAPGNHPAGSARGSH